MLVWYDLQLIKLKKYLLIVERFGIIFTSLLFFSMTLSGLEVHYTHPKPEKFTFVMENFDSIGNLVTRDTFRSRDNFN